jgi:NAD(P)-dependent dehydrogenase (short-subunit alcohol dehydrogenase family)
MNGAHLKLLVVGATGSIGPPVIEEALKQGHVVRVLVRDPNKAKQFSKAVEVAAMSHGPKVFRRRSKGPMRLSLPSVLMKAESGNLRTQIMKVFETFCRR